MLLIQPSPGAGTDGVIARMGPIRPSHGSPGICRMVKHGETLLTNNQCWNYALTKHSENQLHSLPPLRIADVNTCA